MHKILFCLLFFAHPLLFSQVHINGVVKDAKSGKPIPFATVKTNNSSYTLSSLEGKFVIHCPSISDSLTLTLSHLKYHSKTVKVITLDIEKIEINLEAKKETSVHEKIDITDPIAIRVIKEALVRKKNNNPQKALKGYSYKSYNKLKITADNQTLLKTPDTTNVDIEHLFNQTHSFLSEKISSHQFKKNIGEKETVLATRMTGFKEPIHTLLGIKIQSNSLYNEEYTIFNNTYIGPLSKKKCMMDRPTVGPMDRCIDG